MNSAILKSTRRTRPSYVPGAKGPFLTIIIFLFLFLFCVCVAL